MYKHIILFKFKESISTANALELLHQLGELKNKIPGIRKYSYGMDDGDNTNNLGFEYAFVMEFGSKQDRDAYQINEHHQTFINETLNYAISEAIVFDMVVAEEER
ncbi:Dabb family protein [Serratia proteamaculans]|uniref:Dabb family protein n=1 Tax=Serratia proteamaculans TaxID=28151 RepID=UPI002179010F|nr:Dabb family protein [Serratia proteamaculans]CAI1824587.1 Stress responsive A/B Barrel Domain [Serratia proteamaculans]CAI2409990.1 Stress responsive A/B Barrel Domain [Serratia proteamaculans]CAI2488603.1 Stress responsive A/B Barrel Domain [Serratia proteamaculans]